MNFGDGERPIIGEFEFVHPVGLPTVVEKVADFHDAVAVNTLLVIASTPTAINAVVTAKIHDLNVNVAMAAFAVTTVMFVLLVFPLLAFVLT